MLTPAAGGADNSCFVALVHNGHAVRNEYVMPRLKELCLDLNAEFKESSWQPPLDSHSCRIALGRDFRYTVLEMSWAGYRGVSTRGKLHILLSRLRHRFVKYLKRGNELATWRRRSFIETIVTAKHVSCWRAFLESGARYLICCEDDIVFRDDSASRLCAYIESLKHSPDAMLYADLAGGVPSELLAIDGLVRSREVDRIVYERPTTNTACSYLLSRPLAADFLRQILVRPSLRLVGIDWMMNAMFMDQMSRGISCACVHFSPSLFGHGTFTGEYVSWQASVAGGG